MQIGRDQHETDVRFRRDHAQSEELSRFQSANFLDEGRERDLPVSLFLRTEQLPLSLLNPVIEMEAMPALLGNQRRVVLVHRVRPKHLPAAANARDNILLRHEPPEIRDSDRSVRSRHRSRIYEAARSQAATALQSVFGGMMFPADGVPGERSPDR